MIPDEDWKKWVYRAFKDCIADLDMDGILAFKTYDFLSFLTFISDALRDSSSSRPSYKFDVPKEKHEIILLKRTYYSDIYSKAFVLSFLVETDDKLVQLKKNLLTIDLPRVTNDTPSDRKLDEAGRLVEMMSYAERYLPSDARGAFIQLKRLLGIDRERSKNGTHF